MTFQDKIIKAGELIKEYTEKYPRYGIACSWGKDSMVLIHLAKKSLKKHISIFTVLSDTEFRQTLDLKDEMMFVFDFYEFNFQQSGLPDDCCRASKIDKFKEALQNYDCWFSGLRKDEGATRCKNDYVVEQDRFGKIKVNPLLDFTEKDIWRYLAVYQMPVNPLYAKYRSLGCLNCSVKEEDEDEPERAGRWKGTSNEGGECGIHSI